MITLCIRYTFDPNKLADFRKYVEEELEPIRRSGARRIEYFLPTEFAGASNEALGLVDFQNLADYEQYRVALANDPVHKTNARRLEESGAVQAMTRSIIRRVGQPEISA